MADIKIEFSEAENVLRSVGAEPNGILMVGGDANVGATLAVHASVEVPIGVAAGYVAIPGNAVREGKATPIEAGPAIEGCADNETALLVWELVCMTMAARCERVQREFEPEDLRYFVDLAVEVRDALVQRIKG